MKKALLLLTHLLMLALGFGLGVYALPILIAPPAPSLDQVQAMAQSASYKARFRRELKDSDALHWGEGDVYVGPRAVTLAGKLAPGPDYRLYLSPQFVETEADFQRLRPQMLHVGSVRTFSNFSVALPEGVDLARYDTVIVWCESFGQFISAAKYR